MATQITKKNMRYGGTELVYKYTVTGSAKASIDTGVDTAQAGSNDWTNGDLLEIFIVEQTTEAAALSTLNITVNNDTGGNYDRMTIEGDGPSTVVGGSARAATAWTTNSHGNGGTTGYPSSHHLVIPDYAGTTFFKTGTICDSVPDGTSTNQRVDLDSIGYRSSSAITRVKIAAGSGNLAVGSQLLIYKR